MRFVEYLKEREEARERLFKDYLRRLEGKPVTVILFGSRARGDHNLLSDYDLLIIYRGSPPPKPHELGINLNAQCFLVEERELGARVYESSVAVAALLEGRVLVDGLGIAERLGKLAERIREEGGSVSRDRVTLPRPRR